MSTPASDLYQQNAGVRSLNSGPIVIRTYNDLSGNNTYFLGKYDIPISSNYVLITSADGKLAPSNAIYVSSIAGSTMNASIVSASTVSASTVSASTVISQFINYSTLSGSTISTNSLAVTNLIASNISVSSLALNNFLSLTGSTITTNTQIVNSTLLVSTLIAANISVSSLALDKFSTLTGSSIIASTLVISTITTNTQIVNSTLLVSTLIAANISVSSLALDKFSTLTGSSIIASTLVISTITSGNINYSTLTGSTITSNTVLIQSTITSTLNASGLVSIAATQSNLDYPKFGQNWTAITSQLTSTGYNGCAMSASGQYQVVINSSGGIYYSSNYGQSWVQTLSSVVFNYVAMSSSGEYVLAYNNVSTYVANMYVLSNYGQLSSYVTIGNRLSAAIAISASGQYMATVGYGNVYLNISNNYGQSWYQSYSGMIPLPRTAVTISASGQYMIVASRGTTTSQTARVYTSNNYGQSWSEQAIRNFAYVHDIVNSASGQYACFTYGDQVYYSNSYGYSWNLSSNITNVYSLNMSASGQYVLAGNGTNIYYSTNYGQNWTLSPYVSSDNSYTGVAISASGQYVLALSSTGANTILYSIPTLISPISIVNTTINPATSLSLLAPNITESIVPTTTSHGIIIGQAASAYNSFQILYNHVGVGNAANYISISPYNSVNGLNIAANGYIGIGLNTPLSLFHVNGDININNITIGRGSGNVPTNTAIGFQIGYQITTGYYNTIIGYQGGYSMTTGYSNTIMGLQAGYSITTGYNNTILGLQGGFQLTTGYSNTIIGLQAGYPLTTGYSNTIIGSSAGNTLTTGFQNVYIGSGATASTSSVTNEIVIGSGVTGLGTNTVNIGSLLGGPGYNFSSPNFSSITTTITATSATSYNGINLTNVNGYNLFNLYTRVYLVSISGTSNVDGTLYYMMLQPSSGTEGNLSSAIIITPNGAVPRLSTSGTSVTVGTISSSTIYLYVEGATNLAFNITFMRIGY